MAKNTAYRSRACESTPSNFSSLIDFNMQHPEIEIVGIESLTPCARNSRTHNDTRPAAGPRAALGKKATLKNRICHTGRGPVARQNIQPPSLLFMSSKLPHNVTTRKPKPAAAEPRLKSHHPDLEHGQ